jgi:hypothetical protein
MSNKLQKPDERAGRGMSWGRGHPPAREGSVRAVTACMAPRLKPE